MQATRFVEPSAVSEDRNALLRAVQETASLEVVEEIRRGAPTESLQASLKRLRAWTDLASNGRSFWAQRAGFAGVERASNDLRTACVAVQNSYGRANGQLDGLEIAPDEYSLDRELPSRLLAAGYLMAADEARSFYRDHRSDRVFAVLAQPKAVAERIDACLSPGGAQATETMLPLAEWDRALSESLCRMIETVATCAKETQDELPVVQQMIDASLDCVESLQSKDL